MKQSEFEVLVKKYLLPYLPGFAVKGGLVFSAPIKSLLYMIIFVPSIRDKNKFWISAAVQPLYIPYDTIVFMFQYDLWSVRKRAINCQRWLYIDNNLEDIMADARQRVCEDTLEWFNTLQTPIDLISNGIYIYGTNDPHYLRSVTYSWIISGKQAEASTVMERLLSNLRSDDSPSPWQIRLLEEALHIKALLHDDIRKAQEELLNYRQYTLNKLGLEKWAISRDDIQLGTPE